VRRILLKPSLFLSHFGRKGYFRLIRCRSYIQYKGIYERDTKLFVASKLGFELISKAGICASPSRLC
jgi:hypothetical protein